MKLSWTSPALSLLSWSHAASQCSTLIYQTFQQKLKPYGGISRNMRLHNVSWYRQTYHQFPEVPVSGSRNTAQTWWWSPDNDLWWLWSSGTEMKLLPSQTSEAHFRNHGDGWKHSQVIVWYLARVHLFTLACMKLLFHIILSTYQLQLIPE